MKKTLKNRFKECIRFQWRNTERGERERERGGEGGRDRKNKRDRARKKERRVAFAFSPVYVMMWMLQFISQTAQQSMGKEIKNNYMLKFPCLCEKARSGRAQLVSFLQLFQSPHLRCLAQKLLTNVQTCFKRFKIVNRRVKTNSYTIHNTLHTSRRFPLYTSQLACNWGRRARPRPLKK